MPIDPRVRSGWAAFNTPLEGCENFLYLDTHHPPIPTTAIGCIVPTLAAMHALPWRGAAGELVDATEVSIEWARVTSMSGGLVASHYRGPIYLDADGIAGIVGERLDADVEILARFWPGFAAWPAAAQAAICSLAWAVGPGAQGSGITGSRWPHLHAAVAAGTWEDASVAGVLSTVENPGVAPRNLATRTLFLLAAGLSFWDAVARVNIHADVGRPSDDAAAAALAAFADL